MPLAVRLREDYSAKELRALARRSKDVNQSRRLLSLAAVRDGMDRGGAAKIGGMDRQTLRDWVHRFNALKAFWRDRLEAAHLSSSHRRDRLFLLQPEPVSPRYARLIRATSAGMSASVARRYITSVILQSGLHLRDEADERQWATTERFTG